MYVDDNLHQKMIEYLYGLLPDAEAKELAEKISSDPDVARAYSLARQDVELISQAAQLEAPQVALRKPKRDVSVSADSAAGSSQAIHWAIGIAAALLVMVASAGYFMRGPGRDALARKHVRMIVTGPAKFQPGVDNSYTVRTTTIQGQPLAKVAVEYTLLPPEHAKSAIPLHYGSTKSNDQGEVFISIPAKLSIERGTRLELSAEHGSASSEVTTSLDVRPKHFVTHLATDKPLYMPGETLRFRSLTLSRFGKRGDEEHMVEYELLDPGDAAVPDSQRSGLTRRGVGSGEIQIPAGAAGGPYTLIARSTVGGTFPEEKITINVRRYRPPRLKKELELTRDSYTPGDRVTADFAATRAEGGAVADAALQVIARVDGEVVFSQSAKASDAGSYRIDFTLPEEIEIGDAQLVVIVDDGGTRETIAKPIEISLGKVNVEFFPEGGDLVAGLENRVYFVARDPLSKPMHVEGRVVDGDGKELASGTTSHEGMGRFAFTPAEGEDYTFELDKPANVKVMPVLPPVSATQSVVLATGEGVYDANSPLEFTVAASKAGVPHVVAAYCRGMQVGQSAFATVEAGHSLVKHLPVADAAGGVIRLTLFDYSGPEPQPVAERLVYRKPSRVLNIQANTQSSRYAPGEKVAVDITVTNENDKPVSAAVLGASVVDDAVLSLAKQDNPNGKPSMPTHFLLASEVENPEDLEDLNFYLSDEPDAAKSLDLLLGTQGWRRFVERSLEELLAEGGTGEQGASDEERTAQLERLVDLGAAGSPPAMFDNLAEIAPKYREALHTERTGVASSLFGLGQVLVGLSGLFVVGVGLLVLFKLATDARVWTTGLIAAGACLIAGVMYVQVDRATGELPQLAWFNTYEEEPELALADTTTELGGEGWGVGGFGGGFDEDEAAELEADFDDAAPGEVPVEALDPAEAPPEDKLNDAPPVPTDEAAGDDNDDAAAPAKPVPPLVDLPQPEEPKPDPNFEEKLEEEDAEFANNDELEDIPADEPFADGEFAGGRGRGDGGYFYFKQLQGRWKHAKGKGNWKQAIELRKQLDELGERLHFRVRQYAHHHRKSTEPGVRSDFASTLYWHPLLVTDEDGMARIEFDLSDSVTTFRVTVDGHHGGRLGTGDGEVVSRIPFSLEPKLPLEVTAGDRIDLPLAVANDTNRDMPVALELVYDKALLTLEGEAKRALKLLANQRGREFFPLLVSGAKGEAKVEFRGTADHLGDAVRKTIRVVPTGFPVERSFAGMLADKDESVSIKLPEKWVDGSLDVKVHVYPTTLADLRGGIEDIFREPYGCFEQASSSNYPNVLALQYMEEHDVAAPDITKRARTFLKSGYEKLVGYECKQKGYEWFGGDPGHEALTAYGLLEFRDMGKVHDVDEKMIDRTAKWLMARRDGKGGFKRNARALDSFGSAPEDITNAYICWALTESGQGDLKTEIEHVVKLARASEDPYLISLAAASAHNADQKAAAKELLEKLKGLQEDDGHLEAKETSITRSGGQSLTSETTALAVMAWLKDKSFSPQANKAIEWINSQRQGRGGFGSTQATILALRALVEHAKANKRTTSAGQLTVLASTNNGDPTEVSKYEFAAGHADAISTDNFSAKLKPGDNELLLKLTGDNEMPYNVELVYRSEKPASDDDCPVRLSTELAAKKVAAGDTVGLSATLDNITDKGQPMTIAILGLPAGLEPQVQQLDDLKKAGTIDYYELRDREVICYWRSLAPNRKVDIKIDLVAEIPGSYTGPASRAYLYYTAEQKQWVDPLTVEIGRE